VFSKILNCDLIHVCIYVGCIFIYIATFSLLGALASVLYQVLNKQVPVPVPVQVPIPNLQVPVPVQVLCINYRHSVTLQLHKVKDVVCFIFKKRTVITNELQTQSVVKHHQSDLLVSTQYGRSDLLHFKYIRFDSNFLLGNKYFVTSTSTSTRKMYLSTT